jgi:hypothetical protein
MTRRLTRTLKVICRGGIYPTPTVPYRCTSSETAGGKACGIAHSLILRAATNGSTNRALQILTSPSGTRLEEQICQLAQRTRDGRDALQLDV